MQLLRNILFSALFVVGCSAFGQSLQYPATRGEAQIDNYHGTFVPDPYRWLEDDRSNETGEWVRAQNVVTREYLSRIPFRNAIEARLTDLINTERYSAPMKLGKYYIYSRNSGLQNQSVIYIQEGLKGKAEVLLDPNAMDPSGTTSVSMAGASKSKQYLAVNISKAGSDWSSIRILDLAKRTFLPDEIQWVKFSGAAWKGDEGFFYSRYPQPEAGKEFSGVSGNQKVYFHKLGQAQSQDPLVYEDPANPLRYYSLGITEDQQYALLYISTGTGGSSISYAPLHSTLQFKPLIEGFDHRSSVIAHHQGRFLVITDKGAPRNRVVWIDPNNATAEHWQNFLPEQADAKIQTVTTVGGQVMVGFLKSVSSVIAHYGFDGRKIRDIRLPGIGTCGLAGGYTDDTEMFYTFTSYTYPTTIFRYTLKDGKSEVFKKLNVKFRPDDYITTQVYYKSKDGTSVPMFITHKKGLQRNGNNPTLLYAYGGFNINLTPSFTNTIFPLLDNGGIYAVANLRGGGEFGDAWHKAGMLKNKQNVFDDFIAAAEYLIAEKYTSSAKLGIQGGSNGGLLVGAVTNQRPDLFRVAIPMVGVMDMLRFQKFTVGWGWVNEYGSSDDAEMFPYLLGYSPLHNLRPAWYPSVMVTTADHDDRVVPAHSFKYAAALQKVNLSNSPTLIRIETDAGHGAGVALSKSIALQADILSFLLFETQSGYQP